MSEETARLDRMLSANLLWFGRVLNKRFEDLLASKGGGLTMPQARILLRLDHFGPLGPRVLAAATEMEPPALARTVSHMERLGLVRRNRDSDDRREVVVDLTRAGRRKVPELVKLFAEADAWLTKGLPREVAQRLVARLSSLRERLCASAPAAEAAVQEKPGGDSPGAFEEAS